MCSKNEPYFQGSGRVHFSSSSFVSGNTTGLGKRVKMRAFYWEFSAGCDYEPFYTYHKYFMTLKQSIFSIKMSIKKISNGSHRVDLKKHDHQPQFRVDAL